LSKKKNHNGYLVVESVSKQDYGWFEERLTLSPDGTLRVQSGYGDASNGDLQSWYVVGPDEDDSFDPQEAVNWPETLPELFCCPGEDQSEELTELLGVPVRFSRHN
jgi:hypothetical protein